MAVPVIRTRKLTKYYGKHRGIEELDLEVSEGELFGFIGPNGAGKTTTIRTLLGLLLPSSGTAELFGVDAVARGPEARRRVGYVPSEIRYYPGMTVREMLRYAGALHGLADPREGLELAERLELDTDRRVEELSSGNARKAAIAQALLHRPELLVLDEPTSGLDPLMQQRFAEILSEQSACGATIFLSSHVLSEVQRLCRRVGIVKDGRLVACEDIATLRQKRLKKVAITGARSFGPSDFPSGSASAFSANGEATRFLYAGEADGLVRELARLRIEDLVVEEPTLEEIFLHYYRSEGST